MGYGTSQTYPNPISNGLTLFPVEIYGLQGYRGRMPGLWVPAESTNGAFITGNMSVEINGVTFIAIKIITSGGTTNPGNCWLSLDKSHWEIV
jgi:hypothetical protein